jgi:hypothetical protein
MATSATGRPGPIAKLAVVGLLLGSIGLATGVGAAAPPDERPGPPSAEAVANAQPRDLVIDERGLGYLRGASGELTPYGHSVAAVNRPIEPRAPGGVPGPPGGGGGTDDGTVTFGQWGFGGQVLKSSGRILFQMADGWYVCSGTAVTDSATDRSIVLTAAHCIYDDVAKAFALQAIFIPNQDDGESDKTDWNCSNDPYGCWILDHGVVDLNWTNRTFPDNIAWDYGFYVVSDTNAWSITSDYQASGDLALDGTVGTLALDLAAPDIGVTAHALGYSYDVDPELMYCKEPLATESTYGDFWLGKCDMSGGSSGGPWVQPMDEATGMGPVFSVNSWGYTSRSGMGGPVLHGSSAGLLFDFAQQSAFGVTAGGYVVNPDSTTINASPTATITAPADGSSVVSGTSIAFAGSANDTEDGDLDVRPGVDVQSGRPDRHREFVQRRPVGGHAHGDGLGDRFGWSHRVGQRDGDGQPSRHRRRWRYRTALAHGEQRQQRLELDGDRHAHRQCRTGDHGHLERRRRRQWLHDRHRRVVMQFQSLGDPQEGVVGDLHRLLRLGADGDRVQTLTEAASVVGPPQDPPGLSLRSRPCGPVGTRCGRTPQVAVRYCR